MRRIALSHLEAPETLLGHDLTKVWDILAQAWNLELTPDGQPWDARILPADPHAEELGVSVLDPAAEDLFMTAWLRVLQLRGVTIRRPATCWVDLSCAVSPGSSLFPGVVLTGTTVINEGAVVQAGCQLHNTKVGPNAMVKAHTVADGALIGASTQVGPMAHLRTGSDLRDQVKVGNFVEVKKAVLHTGAKASHLSYIGDADIGAGANLGAGTITCNYDGFNKHKTVVGERAFVGSNSSLVAPVVIGAGAMVGAGSVATVNVPDDALLLARGRPRVFEGRAAEINARNKAIKDAK